MSSDHSFMLEALVDFPDDAMAASQPVTPAHIDALMRRLAESGVRRVSWASYGDGHGGYFLPDGYNASWTCYARTLDILGDPLRVAVEAGHRYGMEVYGYFKPYETGPAIVFPEGSPEARAYGRLWQQGGYLTWLDPFVVRHPELRIRRHPDTAPGNSEKSIGAIQLMKKDDTPTRVTGDHLQIWGSDLNYRYRRLPLDFRVEESVAPAPRDVWDMDGRLITPAGKPVRILTLSGFRLTDRYVLVTTDFQDGPADFENTGVDMMTALDENGREIPGVFATGGAIWAGDRVDFRNWGLVYDYGWARKPIRLDEPNSASAETIGYGSGRKGLIAFTADRNTYLPGALCETEPTVQAYWLTWIREMIAAGVDGVDFRVENHSTHTDFPEEYGYNDIILERAAARCPSDPLSVVAEVRGEAYTAFLKESSTLLRAHGRTVRVNLNIDFFRPDPPPGRLPAYPLNIRFDWIKWVEAGLMDAAILRFFHLPFECLFEDPVARDMIDACRSRSIPLTVNRYINADYEAEFHRVRRDGRFDGFVLYETAGAGAWDDQERWGFTSEPAAAVCRAFSG